MTRFIIRYGIQADIQAGFLGLFERRLSNAAHGLWAGSDINTSVNRPDLAVHLAADVAIQVASDVANEGSRQSWRSIPFPCGRVCGSKGPTYICRSAAGDV